MDPLLRYIKFRQLKYKNIEESKAQSSSYYTFGNIIVRISDHLKYGMDGMSQFNYCFIIQADNNYIFTVSPKDQTSTQLFLKIVTLEEAKSFIKRLHDFQMQFGMMNDIYHPKDWNDTSVNIISRVRPKLKVIDVEVPEDDDLIIDANNRYDWSDFYDKFVKNSAKDIQISIFDNIDVLTTGILHKGSYETKLARSVTLYKKLTNKQYQKLMKKVYKKTTTDELRKKIKIVK